MQNCGVGPPSFVTWAEGFSTPTVGQDLFFWSSPDFGQENGLILGGKIFIPVVMILKFSEFPAPPPLSKILGTLLVARQLY